MNLQQPSTFWPFMRELISSTAIARRASNNNIIRPICTAAIQGDDMIVVMFSPFQFLLTPIALAFLSLILFFCVLTAICTFCIEFARVAIMIAFSKFLLYFRAATIGFIHSSVVGLYFLAFVVSFLLNAQSFMVLLAVFGVVVVAIGFVASLYFRTITIDFVVCLVIYAHAFFDFWAALVFLALGACAFLALRFQTVFYFGTTIKEVVCCRKNFLAYCALLLRGVFRYDAIHSKGYSLLSRLGTRQRRSGITIFPHYTITPLVMQVYEVIS